LPEPGPGQFIADVCEFCTKAPEALPLGQLFAHFRQQFFGGYGPHHRSTFNEFGNYPLAMPWMLGAGASAVFLAATAVAEKEGAQAKLPDLTEFLAQGGPPGLKLFEMGIIHLTLLSVEYTDRL